MANSFNGRVRHYSVWNEPNIGKWGGGAIPSADYGALYRACYAAIKAEMKGRYPRHPWPDDPLAAPATRRAKPRGQ